MRALALFAFSLVIVGCSALTLSPTEKSDIYSALDTQADGYSSSLGTMSYTIIETRASATKLCRVVEIDQPDKFNVESFCKARGGSWR